MATTMIGQSQFYSYYVLVSLFIETVIPMCLLFIFSIMNITEFKKIMANKLKMVGEENQRMRRTELRFTKLIIILTFIFILAHTLDTMSTISMRFVNILQLLGPSQPFTLSIISLCRQISYFVVFFQHATGIFVYFLMDKNIKGLAIRTLNKMVVIKS